MDTLLTLLRASVGIVGLLALCWWLSEDRRRIDWTLVGTGIALQVVLGLLILKVTFFHAAMEGVSGFFNRLVGFSDDGASMVFGSMPTDVSAFGMAWTVLSAIVFFSAFRRSCIICVFCR